MILIQILMTRTATYAFLTHCGLIRSANEDSILIDRTVVAGVSMDCPEMKEISRFPTIFCVADGVGGSVHGEIASRMVLESFSGYSALLLNTDGISDLIAGAKEVLDTMVMRDPSYNGFGTTIAGLILSNDQALVFNCGDSRVYRIDQGSIERISHDHSLVQEFCDQGMITPDQVYSHPYRNIITAVISGDLHRPAPPFTSATVQLSGSERFLICTDGVWEMVRDDRLAVICSEEDLVHASAVLLSDCLSAGGHDNISFILLDPNGSLVESRK